MFDLKKEDAKLSRKQLPPKAVMTLALEWARLVDSRSVPFKVPKSVEQSVPSFVFETSYSSDEIRGIRKSEGDSVLTAPKMKSNKPKKMECLCAHGECAPGSEFCRQPCPNGWSGNLCSIPDDKKITERRKKEEREAKSEGTIYVKKGSGESTRVERPLGEQAFGTKRVETDSDAEKSAGLKSSHSGSHSFDSHKASLIQDEPRESRTTP